MLFVVFPQVVRRCRYGSICKSDVSSAQGGRGGVVPPRRRVGEGMERFGQNCEDLRGRKLQMELYQQLLYALSRRQVQRARENFGSLMDMDDSILEVKDYVEIVVPFSKVGSIEDAENVVRHATQRLGGSDVRLSNALLRACVLRTDLDRMWKVYADMKNAGMKMTRRTCQHLVAGCLADENLSAAFQVLDEFESLSLQYKWSNFRDMLRCSARAGDFSSVEQIVERMEERGLSADAEVYNMRIRAARIGGDNAKMSDVLEEMKDRGFKPNQVTFAEVISGFAENGDVESMWEQVSSMKRHKVRPSVRIFTAVVLRLCESEERDKLITFMREMRIAKLNANSVVYNAIIGLHVRLGDFAAAMETLRRMQVNDRERNIDTCNALFRGDIDERGRMPDYTVFLSRKTDPFLTAVVLDSYLWKEQYDRALALVMQLGETDSISCNIGLFNCMTEWLCRLGAVEEAVKGIRAMSLCGVTPNIRTYTPIVCSLCERTDVVGVRAWLEEMRERDIGCRYRIRMAIERLRKQSQSWYEELRPVLTEMDEDVFENVVRAGLIAKRFDRRHIRMKREKDTKWLQRFRRAEAEYHRLTDLQCTDLELYTIDRYSASPIAEFGERARDIETEIQMVRNVQPDLTPKHPFLAQQQLRSHVELIQKLQLARTAAP